MRVLVTGGTGFIGAPLVRGLCAAGHAVRVLTRNPQVTQARLPPGAEAAAWSAPQALPPALLAGVDAVVHLAGENIGQWPWTPERKRRMRASRVAGTRAVVEAIGKARAKGGAETGPDIFLAASAIGWYGDGGDRLLREDDAAGRGFLADLVQDWEREIFAAEALGLRTAVFRLGVVLGNLDVTGVGGALAKLIRPFSLGLGAVLGKGDQWMSWIGLEDVVGAFLLALERAEMRGAYNCCAPEPVTNRAFSRALAQALRRPLLLRVPAFALRLALGEMAGETLLVSQRASADRLLRAGYHFRYPTLEATLARTPDGTKVRPRRSR